jgi:hypothetical protein
MADKIIATITTKGQITTSQGAGPQAGDQIAFDPSGTISARIEPQRKRSIFERIDELKLPSLGRPLTQKDIDDSVAAAMVDKYGAGARGASDRHRHRHALLRLTAV